jgi:UDP-glucose 4-epimerase
VEKVLVTGGLGFIGSHVVDYFLNNGDEVTLIDNLSSNVLSPEYFKSNAGVDVHIGDISDASTLEKIFSKKNYEYIFHLAAMASVPRSVEDEDLNFRSNVLGTYNIMKKAIEHSSSVIFGSTAAIYGEYDGKAVQEESPAKPISPYGVSKLIGENVCFYYSRIHTNKVVILRLFNVYGPRQRRYVMSDFLEKLGKSKDKEHIVMLGTGNEIRDFININDVLKAMVLPLKNDNLWGEAFNIGSGNGIKIKDALSIMLRELGLNYSLSFSGKSWQGDVSGIRADNSKIKSFGFNPTIDLGTGIREFINAERKNGLPTTNSLKTISE